MRAVTLLLTGMLVGCAGGSAGPHGDPLPHPRLSREALITNYLTIRRSVFRERLNVTICDSTGTLRADLLQDALTAVSPSARTIVLKADCTTAPPAMLDSTAGDLLVRVVGQPDDAKEVRATRRRPGGWPSSWEEFYTFRDEAQEIRIRNFPAAS